MTPSDVAVSVLATVALCVVTAALRPHAVRCPSGWRAGGVTPSGAFTCDLPHGCRDDYHPRGGWISHCDGMLSAQGSVYCTNGQEPIVGADGVTIACQARH